jgi:predicted MFS family arabinose efflux permease
MSNRSTLELMGSRAYRAWVLVMLFLTALVGFVDRQIIGGLGQPIKADLGLSDAQLGLLGGLAFALLNAAFTIPVARIAETRSRKLIIGIGLLAWSVATCGCGLARSYVQLLIARVAVGVGEAAGTPISQSLMSDYFPREKRTSAAAAVTLAIPLGALIGTAGGGFIAQHWDWRLAFVLAGAPGLPLAALFLLTVREPLRGHYDPPALAEQPAPPFGAVIKRMLARPGFLHVQVGSTLAAMGTFGINLFLAPYFFRRYGLDFQQAALISGLISAVAGSVSMYGGGQLADLIGRKDPRFYAWLPGIGIALTAPLYLISFLQASWPAAVALLTITGVLQYAYLPASIGVTQNTMEPRMRATAGALVAIMTNLIAAGFGPLIVGALSDHFARRAAPAPTASATGLQQACMLFSLVYLWAAVHFALAGRTLKRDMA